MGFLADPRQIGFKLHHGPVRAKGLAITGVFLRQRLASHSACSQDLPDCVFLVGRRGMKRPNSEVENVFPKGGLVEGNAHESLRSSSFGLVVKSDRPMPVSLSVPACERGWLLRELTRSRHSLEDIYVQVTRPNQEDRE